MKTIIPIALVLLAISSCTKDPAPQNPSVTGNWKLTATYSGYGNGGNFEWTPVPSSYSKQLTFLSNGRYTEITNSNGSIDTCSGEFQLTPDSLLQRNSACSSFPVNRKLSEYSSLHFVLDHNVIEGVIKEKYVKL